MPQKTLRVVEVAEVLATTSPHVLALINQNRLVAINVGAGKKRPRWRVTPEALQRFLDEGQSVPVEATRARRRPAVPQYV